MTSEATVPEAALLPCPFCGGESSVFGLGPYRCTCKDCDASTALHYTASPDETIAAWNRRAALPHLPTAIHDAALEEAHLLVKRMRDEWATLGDAPMAVAAADDIIVDLLTLKGKSIPVPANAALEEETRFLIERLDELEQTILSGEAAEEIYREFNGHVAPSIARLRSALKSIPAPAEGNEAEATGRLSSDEPLTAKQRRTDEILATAAKADDTFSRVLREHMPSAAPAQAPRELISRLREVIAYLAHNAQAEKAHQPEIGAIDDAIAALTRQEQRGAVEVSDAARDVLAERRRQVESEGWTPEHDDGHRNGELAYAAAAYAGPVWPDRESREECLPPIQWPWDVKWWRFSVGDPRRNFVKAAALLIAEIERLDRAPVHQEAGDE